MAKASFKLFNSPSQIRLDGTFPLYLMIYHDRKRRYTPLSKYCTTEQWNEEKENFRRSYPDYKKENIVLNAIKERANGIIRDFERYNTPFTFEVFNAEFLNNSNAANVQERFKQHINKLMNEGKASTASPFLTTLNALLEFAETKKANAPNFDLTDIGYKFLIDFESWLRTDRKLKDTSISVYMRSIRTIYNSAIKERIVKKDSYPFDQYSIGERLNTKTQPRAISKEQIKQIMVLELPEHSPEQLAKHIFLFSYFTRGMNFVDIARLTKENIQGERLFYTRSKTKKTFSIKLLPQAKKILNYYIENKVHKGRYIFPIFDESVHVTDKQKYDRRKTALRKVNKHLKVIAKMIGEENLNLTTYVARHAYATVLKQSGTPTAKISEALGHQTEQITQIYLKQFENSELDELDQNLL